MSEKMTILSAAYGPMPNGGGTYAKIWVTPLTYEDRGGEHQRRGPAPFEMKADIDFVKRIFSDEFPAIYDLDLQTSIGSNQTATVFCKGGIPDKKPLGVPSKI